MGEAGGVYTLCVQLTEAAFSDAYPKVRTQVKFSSEFHRNRRLKKVKSTGGVFGADDVNLVDKQAASGNMHPKQKEYEKAATEGHFAPVFRRLSKLEAVLDDIHNF